MKEDVDLSSEDKLLLDKNNIEKMNSMMKINEEYMANLSKGIADRNNALSDEERAEMVKELHHMCVDKLDKELEVLNS